MSYNLPNNPYQSGTSARQTYSGGAPLSRPSSRAGSRSHSPAPGAHSQESVVPDSQDDTVRLPPPAPTSAPPQLDPVLLKAVKAIQKFPSNFNKSPFAELYRGSALRTLAGCLATLVPSNDELFSAIRNIDRFVDIFDDLESRAAAPGGNAEMTTDDEDEEPSGLRMFDSIPSADKLKGPTNPLPARLSLIERTLADIQASLAKLATKPAAPTPAVPLGSPSKPKTKGPAPKGQAGGKKDQPPQKPAPAPPAATTTTTTTPTVEVTTQIAPKDTYASKAATKRKFNRTPESPRKCDMLDLLILGKKFRCLMLESLKMVQFWAEFNPSPKEPSAYRRKVKDPQPFGEVLFSPSTPFLNDQDPAPASGQGAINTLNVFLASRTPQCSVKGLKWTPRGNVLLTPQSPDQWDILAINGAVALAGVGSARGPTPVPVVSLESGSRGLTSPTGDER
ncbi:hypothetical protein BOTBODRAFT_170800 [Botryobasidium botryosum FD-172 SS1]|uniref:Uncharacterized protein n=1 Tax=Botryobasidium botryosum (strain FD-172 SS1) TaxID=930990 RepID=A0A067MST6_BOTB1|nr:hypothetical protein BOTBODRAFT_170800 [Botryobasidium botryosum FD-172 SS1]